MLRLFVAVLACGVFLVRPVGAFEVSKLSLTVRAEQRWTDEEKDRAAFVRSGCRTLAVIRHDRDVVGSVFADFELGYPLPYRGLGAYVRAGHGFQSDVDEASVGLAFHYGGPPPGCR
jgi:hypothetical protein